MTLNQSSEKFAESKRNLRTCEGTMKVCKQCVADSVMYVKKKGRRRMLVDNQVIQVYKEKLFKQTQGRVNEEEVV